MLKVKRLSPDAILPTVAHPGEDIGYDLYSVEEITIEAQGAAGVHTGIAIEFVPPAGGIVKTRSGLAKKRLLCNAGVIDAGYRGEIVVLMENLGDQPFTIRRATRLPNCWSTRSWPGRLWKPTSATPHGAAKALGHLGPNPAARNGSQETAFVSTTPHFLSPSLLKELKSS